MNNNTDRTGLDAASEIAARIDAPTLLPGLYLVATPIGAARDITLRALDVLNAAEVLAAEDTRVLRHLMEIHAIPLRGRRIIAYHDHNADRARPGLLARLAEGASVAFCSDAGTPMVADPGFKLARDAAAMGLRLHPVPGASAALAALTVAGLPSDRFLFAGFPPNADGARDTWLRQWGAIDATLILYESPRRVKDTLAKLCEIEPNRSIVICRELTKKFEELIRGTAAELAEQIPDEGLRGEVVLVLDRPAPVAVDDDAIRAELRQALQDATVKDASREVATRLGLPRRAVYQLALDMKPGDERT
ncbi:16S rRNA (cytidine(1402)-2'-O)-methyltransferase [Paracoccus tegillarcae]|uniref:Ribosomal RNA small subunit methyltransferase I n=1 Tax=Paracoccus tegillarcae TaxID=1529068 RepID=A0A2K9EWI7_9RHOB|nr:16S rRNA (cytidine(1402)-2'-O)-methyltransferase [Paracoccus tegillarcae]AUH32422.1 16S rRNA (cytidine(1402)-2'-O)-methyltransferase [Paracoccus tegillarcae]